MAWYSFYLAIRLVAYNNFIKRPGPTQQTQNICIAFIQNRPNVLDVGPTLHKSNTNVLYLVGRAIPLHILGLIVS